MTGIISRIRGRAMFWRGLTPSAYDYLMISRRNKHSQPLCPQQQWGKGTGEAETPDYSMRRICVLFPIRSVLA